MSFVMDASAYDDRYDVSLQVHYSRELAHNASQIHYYEAHLKKTKSLPQATRADIDYIINMIKILYDEREKLSEKYLKAQRENK